MVAADGPAVGKRLQIGSAMRNEAPLGPWRAPCWPGAAARLRWRRRRRRARPTPTGSTAFRSTPPPRAASRRATLAHRRRAARGPGPADAAADLAARPRPPARRHRPADRPATSTASRSPRRRSGPNRYLGVINVSYVAAQVQALLRQRRHPLRHPPLRPDPGRAGDRRRPASRDAWREASPWRAAWFAGSRTRRSSCWRCRWATSPTSRRRRRAASLRAGDPAVLEALGARYGATTVIVATATAADPALGGPVEIELRRADDWAQPIFRTHGRACPPASDPAAALKPAVAEAIAARSRTTGSGAPRRRRQRVSTLRPPCRLPTSRAGCR